MKINRNYDFFIFSIVNLQFEKYFSLVRLGKSRKNKKAENIKV